MVILSQHHPLDNSSQHSVDRDIKAHHEAVFADLPLNELHLDCRSQLQRRRRRVVFNEEQNEECPSNPSHALTAVDRRRLWWNKDEIRKSRAACREDIAEYKAIDSTNQRKLVYQVYKTAVKVSKSQPLLSTDQKMDLVDAMKIQFEHCRGLHPKLLPTLGEYRNRYVKGLVNVQSKLPEDFTEEQREHTLYSKSMRMTRASKAVAKLFAYVDAISVDEH